VHACVCMCVYACVFMCVCVCVGALAVTQSVSVCSWSKRQIWRREREYEKAMRSVALLWSHGAQKGHAKT